MVGLKKISPKPQGDIFSIEKGGHERESPVPGDHFDFPCCGGVRNEPWHCTLPYSLGTSDMGVNAGLPSVGHRMSHGGKSGSGRDTVIRNTPCQWISCSQSPLVRSVKRDLGQRGRCP